MRCCQNPESFAFYRAGEDRLSGIRITIHVDYTFPSKQKPNANSDERHEYRLKLEKFVTDEFANLDGFELLDEINRYEIVFPPGWRHKA